jgi:S-(hydroxymethyl)glutathione dehydrogenase/alcohol dehydrogenase
VGNIKLMEQALAAARIGWGVCTVIGVAPMGEQIGVSPFDLIMGRKLQGTALGGVRRTQLPQLVDWMMEGRFDLKSLITDRMPLEKINEGYDAMKRGEGLRSVVVF